MAVQPDLRLVSGLPSSSKPLETGGGDGHSPSMEERLRALEMAVGKVEAAIEGLRHSQNLTMGAVGIVFAAVVAFGVYGLQRMDSADAKIGALPGQISGDLRDLTNTLANSIAAARSAPTQVILVPAPQTTPPPAPAK